MEICSNAIQVDCVIGLATAGQKISIVDLTKSSDSQVVGINLMENRQSQIAITDRGITSIS